MAVIARAAATWHPMKKVDSFALNASPSMSSEDQLGISLTSEEWEVVIASLASTLILSPNASENLGVNSVTRKIAGQYKKLINSTDI